MPRNHKTKVVYEVLMRGVWTVVVGGQVHGDYLHFRMADGLLQEAPSTHWRIKPVAKEKEE